MVRYAEIIKGKYAVVVSVGRRIVVCEANVRLMVLKEWFSGYFSPNIL